MEREGYRPAARSRATRRALTGVAAGAVLALGAVVGSLLLNHSGDNSAGDTLASGASGNGLVLTNHQPAVATYPKTTGQSGTQQAPAAIANNTTQPQSVGTPSVSKPRVQPAASAPQQGKTPAAAVPVTPLSAQSAPAAPPVSTGTGGTTPSAPSTSTTSATATPPSKSAPTASTPTSTSSNSNGGGGGLLGSVTGTLTGTLNSVTQPVFNWFGS